MEEKRRITKKTKNSSRWYTDVILKAELADYAPVKGCMVIRPYGYAIWEKVQEIFNSMMKRGKIKNAYFPLFIPESFLKREKEHVEGFSPELAVVTIGGGEELHEKLVVRPTSETIMYEMYSKWIKSWRDLPILINQWCNIVRWEKRTYLFLRTTEFLWQEGHTAHETHKEALDMVYTALDWYQDIYRDYFAIDGVAGKKSNAERFAGGDMTTTYEMLMPDGKALQGCTSHDLGQNFAKVFNIKFLGRSEKMEIPWQTSWGLSTRSIGALIMSHGDDKGLKLPPKLAPVQVVIIPIYKKALDKKKLLAYCDKLAKKLKDFRVEIDSREDQSAGWKYNEWELKGVPLRLEVGENELSGNSIIIVRRDTGEEINTRADQVEKTAAKLLEKIQSNMFNQTKRFLTENTREVKTYQEFKEIMTTKKGFIKAFWCEDPECEVKIKEETKASTRCLPLGAKEEKGKCVYCGKPAVHKWLYAQAY